jgi:hypothetical protein
MLTERKRSPKGPALCALSAALLPKLGDVLVSVAQQGAGCVFSRMLNFLGAGPNPNCSNNAQSVNFVPGGGQFNSFGNGYNNGMNVPQQGGWQQGLQNGPYMAPGGAPQQPGYAAPNAGLAGSAGANALSPQAVAGLSSQPLLTFVVQKLASAAPNAAVLGILAQDSLSAQAEPSFVVHTGEAFALTFSTTVPGRVRLINTDADQAVSVSSLYEAVPGSDNRMPREHEGGVLMTGRPGTEFLDVEFVPCVSPALAQHPAVAGFVGTLPACAQESATRQYSPAQANGKGGLADLGGKAMSFPSNADPTQPVALAPGNYAKGEALRFRLRIVHQAAPL